MIPVVFNSVEEINAWQEKSFMQLIEYVSNHSPFYTEMFNSGKVNLSEIKSLKDLKRIPVTNKEDLQSRNMDFLCVDKSEIIEYCSTSGTLGNPVIIALTDND